MRFEKKIQGKIRIKDIAAKAKVSTGTVDRVLHNRGEVKEETRKNVMAIVDEMGYTPNLLAKSLALKKTYRIAAIIPDASDNNPYWEKPLKGIIKGAAAVNDYNTEVDIYTFNATDESSFNRIIKKVIEEKPSGVVFNPVFKEASLDFVELMDSIKIPYVYVDVDLEKGNNLAYYGQNATQSGKVAAKIMSRFLPVDSQVLIAKLTNHKVISSHLMRREQGFREYFKESDTSNCNLLSVEIDLLEQNEPSETLKAVFNTYPDIMGVFVPNSRVFKVAQFLNEEGRDKTFLMGFDLIQQNVDFLKKDVIDFLISQKPEDQGYNSIMALFNRLVSHKGIQLINHSPIDIIVKENIEYYNKD